MDIKKTGQIIKEAREKSGLTQKELAGRLHISDRTVSKWERGAGFPDVTMLEPLSDQLGVTVQSLISGDPDCKESAAGDDAVRNAVRFVYKQTKYKLRKNIMAIAGSLLIFAVAASVVYGGLQYHGFFLDEIDMEVPASIYEKGQETGSTQVIIKGQMNDGRKKAFWGTFHIECLPATGHESLTAAIEWDSFMDGFPYIYYYRNGINLVDMGMSRQIYISEDMQNFAIELEDGRIIATNNALAALESVEGWRYNINYNGFSFS